MEQSKWMIVSRESKFERFKRRVKKIIFDFFEIGKVEKKMIIKQQYNRKNDKAKLKNSDLSKKEIIIEIIV